MTPEQINVAIAKACGWRENERTWFSPSGSAWAKHYPDGSPINPYAIRPDYCSDLNAMHEAEKLLDVNQQCTFACYLTEPVRLQIVNVISFDMDYYVCFPALHATAAQRAEAFLRTLNLWID